MPLIVFGGGSPSSEVEAASVTLTKPTGEDFRFRVYYTAVNGSKTEFAYKMQDSYNKRAVFDVAKGSALTVMNIGGGSVSYDTVGGVEFVYGTNADVPCMIFDVEGDGEINFTE